MSCVNVYVHIVFGSKYRKPVLTKDLLQKVCLHIKENGEKKNLGIIMVNGYQDHIHCLLKLHNELSVSETARLIKGESAHWINKNQLTSHRFSWQGEYWANSISQTQLSRVKRYILNQQAKHKNPGL